MHGPGFLERPVQGHVTLQSVNPSLHERILRTFNLMRQLAHVLECIMANFTPRMASNVDVVSRRKGRVAAQPWTERSLHIEFPAPGGQEYLDLHFSDNISNAITHHQVANIVADLTDLMLFINPDLWQQLSHVDLCRVILIAIPASLVEELGLDEPGALTLSAKAAPRNRPRTGVTVGGSFLAAQRRGQEWLMDENA